MHNRGKSLVLFIAFSGLLASVAAVPAAAQRVDRCEALSYRSSFEALELSGPPGPQGTSCLHALRDGLAAVQLPAAGQNINDVAALGGLNGHRWGFIDESGHLAIEPRFAAVGDFHAGRARARDGAHWGYIDRKGQWAVKPRFADAFDFSDSGIAAVVSGGQWQLIDRDGQALDISLNEPVNSVFVGDGVPTAVWVSYDSVYQSAAGDTIAIPAGIDSIAQFGQSALMTARTGESAGLIDRDFQWKLDPVYKTIDSPSNGSGLGIASGGPEGDALIKADGTVVDDQLADIHRYGALWIARQSDDRYAIYTLQGSLLAQLDQDAVQHTRKIGDYLIEDSEHGTQIIGGSFEQALTLDSGLRVGQVVAGGLIAVFRDDAAVGFVTPRGHLVLASESNDWVDRVASGALHGSRLWLEDDRHRVINVLDSDGRPILNAETAERIAEYQIAPLETETPAGGEPPVAIGLVNQNPYCQCEPGAGLLMSDGQATLHEDWQQIEPLDTHDGGHSLQTGARYSFQTSNGVGMIDERGKVLLPANQQHIDTFSHGDALVYGHGVAQIVDRDGHLYDIPNGFAMAVVAPEVMRYQETAAAGALLSLFDLKTQTAVTKPTFKTVEDFHGGQAIASSAEGKIGVIDREGRWVLAPAYAAVTPINGQLWAVQRQTSQKPYEDMPQAIVDARGKLLIPYTPHLSVSAWDDGRIEVTTAYGINGNSTLLSASGKRLIDGRESVFSQVGPWLRVTRRAALGYLGQDRAWSIAPQPGDGTEFHAGTARALRYVGDQARIIDQGGDVISTLPKGDWYWPTKSKFIIGRTTANGAMQTQYADQDGNITRTLEGRASIYQNEKALIEPASGGDTTWVDTAGKTSALGHFDDLGLPADNGLAYASNRYYYGFLDAKGRYVIPPVYSSATDFINSRAIVANDVSAMMIDTNGQPVARVTSECEVRVLYGRDNQRLWPEELPQGCRR